MKQAAVRVGTGQDLSDVHIEHISEFDGY